jgi:hypothetical protein
MIQWLIVSKIRRRRVFPSDAAALVTMSVRAPVRADGDATPHRRYCFTRPGSAFGPTITLPMPSLQTGIGPELTAPVAPTRSAASAADGAAGGAPPRLSDVPARPLGRRHGGWLPPVRASPAAAFTDNTSRQLVALETATLRGRLVSAG